MKIGWIEISKKKYGGVLYNEEARVALSKEFDVELVVKEAKLFKNIRYLKIPESFARLLFLNGEKDIWVRDFYSTLTMPYDRTKGKNIVVIHHDDFSGFPLLPRVVLIFLQKTLFYWALKRADVIVTVSEYWNQHFLRKGYKNVRTIYNGFDLAQFDIHGKQVEEFKKKYNLLGKPIVYLGNCQKAKGVVEAYEQLKGLDVHLVTSGRRQVNIPAINLELDYREYLTLLKSASLVLTMSKFKEGWCRTAHEAMLLETPVIGSGKGGMRELLEGGGQLICEDFSQLRPLVERVLHDSEFRDKLGAQGRRFAEGFSIERFSKEWLSFIKSV